jgi:predicted Zn-dependent peptidase
MRRPLILSAIVMLLAVSSMATNPRDMQFGELEFNPAQAVRFETDNGIVVYFLENHELPIVYGALLFKGGTVHDPSEKIGLADLTSTLMRTAGAGDRTGDEVDEALDFVAASIDVSAGMHSFAATFSCLKKDIDLTSALMADILISPVFDSVKMALEISNANDAIRRQNDNSWSIARRVFNQYLYGKHPYGNYATLASLDRIGRDDVKALHQTYFAPDNCIMAVMGDLSEDEVRAIVAQKFGAWEKGDNSIPPVADAQAEYVPGVYYAEKDISQANIRFGHLGLDNRHPDRYAFQVMNFAMGGGGFSSRLTKQVRTTAGLAYTVGSYQYTRPANGAFFGYCLTRADNMSLAAQMMLDIIADVKANGITAEELEIAKESIINSYVFDYDSPGELVRAYANLELMGFPPDQLQQNLAGLKAVTLEDCNRVAAEYLDLDNIVMVVAGNKEMFDKPLETFGPVTAVSMEIE